MISCGHGRWRLFCTPGRAASVALIAAAMLPHLARPAFSSEIGPWRGACPLAGGVGHSIGLKSDGSIASWGRSSEGQTAVPATNAGFAAVAAGWYHSLALNADRVLVAWGDDEADQANVPAPNEDFIAVAGGAYHSLGLKVDGTIVAWGLGDSGQTGVPAPNSNFVEVAAGGFHSLGLKGDGSIAAWGYDYYGQVSGVPAVNQGFVSVAGGAYHSLGLKDNGSVMCWGLNTDGQTTVPVPDTDFVAVAAGGYHSMGLKADGSIVCWGLNTDGQTTVPAPNTNFVAIAAGLRHSLAMKADGTVVIWGRSDSGQGSVPGANANFGQQSGVVPPAGPMGGGTIVTILGANLGSGSDVTNVSLCSVVASVLSQSQWAISVQAGAAPGPTNGDVVVDLAGFGSVTRTNAFTYSALPSVTTLCVMDRTSTNASGAGEILWDGGAAVESRGLCWGTNGNPAVSDSVAVCGGGTGVFDRVVMGGLRPGTLYYVRAWASNSWGVAYGANIPFRTLSVVMAASGPYGWISPRGLIELEYGGSQEFAVVPAEGCRIADVLVDGASMGVTNRFHFSNVAAEHWIRAVFSGIGRWPGASPLAGGGYHSLGLRNDGSIVAWGNTNFNQTQVPVPNSGFAGIAGGEYYSLALRADGTAVAWGRNNYGQTNVPQPNADFLAISAGWRHALGVKRDGRVIAWGDASLGKTSVPEPNAGFVAVAGGVNHSLGVKADGRVVGWGDNTAGQTNVPAPNAGFVAVAAGLAHSLGLKSSGSIVAWGGNTYGQLNVPPPNADFVSVAAGYNHSLGLRADGTIVAWGRNDDYSQAIVPGPDANFVAVAAGGYHSMGLRSDGSIVCWGRNGNMQTVVPSPNDSFCPESGVFPPAGPMSGGTTVTILGANLGSGSDVTGVSLCGVEATVISQSPWAVVVKTGPAPGPLEGDVVLVSAAYGSVTRTDAFTYVIDRKTLTVESPRGGSCPGTVTADHGSGLVQWVTNSPVSGGSGTQYVCMAATVVGNDFTQVSPTNVTLTLTNDATLTWCWQTQYRLTIACGPNGSADLPSGGWHASGSNVTVSATASNYYHFVRWTGSVASAGNPLSLTMDQAYSLIAEFAEDMAAKGTPHSWLAQYGWTNDFDSAETNDVDNDGMPAWQERIAGTDPTDRQSVLSITNSVVQGGCFVIRWPSVSNRTYWVDRATNLLLPGFEAIATNLTATPPENVHTDQMQGSDNTFYRIMVEIP